MLNHASADRDVLVGFRSELEEILKKEKHSSSEFDSAQRELIVRLMRASTQKDGETGAHIARVSEYALCLARYIGLSHHDAHSIAAAATMHDVGKLGLPDGILRKPGPLDAGELATMRTHTTLGAELLKVPRSTLLGLAREVALTHHERWDGSGYPNGLRGKAAPLSGRLVMLADQYDALRSTRSYKLAYSHERACDTILRGDGRTMPQHFDPQLLEAFRYIEAEFDRIYQLCSELPKEGLLQRSAAA